MSSKTEVAFLDGAATQKEQFSLWMEILGNDGLADFYQSFEWYTAVAQLTSESDVSRRLVRVTLESRPIALIPVEYCRFRGRLGTYSRIQVGGNIYTPRRWSVVSAGDTENAASAFVDWLHDGSPKWDEFVWQDADRNDPFLIAVRDEIVGRGPVAIRPEESNVFTDLEAFKTSEEFYRSLSRNTRNNIAKALNKLAREFDVVVCRLGEDSPDVDRGIDDYYSIYARSWKRSERYPEFHRELKDYLQPIATLRLYLMYIKRRDNANGPGSLSRSDSISGEIPLGDDYVPIATYYFVKFDKTAYFLKTAYDEKYTKLSPGTALLWFCLRDLRDTDDCLRIDHQKGDDPYKAKWGNRQEERVSLCATNPASTRLRIERLLARGKHRLAAFVRRGERR